MFVKKRKGIFDFERYSFSIQKRLEFNEFVRLIEKSNLTANCVEKVRVRKEKARVGFGQYKGMFYSELPNSYLVWLKSNYRGYDKDLLDLELKKRNL